MNVWCHIPTIFNRRYALRIAGLLTLCVALITTLLFVAVSRAEPGVNQTLGFHGRLLQASGGVVPDGYYNIQFKVYQDGTGAQAGNPGGTLKWTESHVNNNEEGGVRVKNGYFSVELGALTPFGTSVDWNQDTLWLSMNVAGSAADCTTFGSGSCTPDGEMLPMKRMNGVPYAMNAAMVGGKTADNFIQLAQGVQTDASTNTSSIFINKTGTGNLIQLQNTATDVFTVSETGDLTLGSNTDHTIDVATAEEDTAGRSLTVTAGTGGEGTGSAGGDLVLQGGSAGGTDGDGGNVSIDTGTATGTGIAGVIDIGTTNAGTINIGANTPGSSTDVTVGSSGSADGGTTTIQAKNSVTISTDGTTRATFSDTASTVYFGNGVSAAAPSDFVIQGTNSSASAVAGGSLTVQGGNATAGNANGGNITLAGGSGSGDGASGLVVLTTPTFSTVTDDTNCYTGGSTVATDCTISTSSVDSSSAVLVGFSTVGQTATLPDPTIKTAGRIIYVMAANGSEEFTLSANNGSTLVQLTMKPNTAATLLWNGADWITAGASSSTTLQDAYNATPQGAGGTELVLNNDSGTGGLTIRDNETAPVDGSLLEVQNSTADNLLSVNGGKSDDTDHATDGTVNDDTNFTTNWLAVGSATVARITSDGQEASDSAEITAGTAADNGIRNKLSTAPLLGDQYRLSVYTKLTAGDAFTDFNIRYSPDGGTTFVDCTNYSSQAITAEWTNITCDIHTGDTVVTDPYVYFVQPTTSDSARTFLIDTFSFTLAPSSSNVTVGNGSDGEDDDTTLFTVDKSTSAPVGGKHESLLGSMYYDTTLGKLQCYEAEGWGACGASPDTFITISPEYTNAVMNGTDIGTITSDLCSDTLNINDGSSSQPTICGTNETYNFYGWTSAEQADQTRSIFVTYQLPNNFKEFVPGSTSLSGRTDSTDSNVNYQVYRDSKDAGLISCGSPVSVSTGAQTTWQKATATDGADPSTCGFEPGESIFLRINLTSKNDANAYVSNIAFTFSNN